MKLNKITTLLVILIFTCVLLIGCNNENTNISTGDIKIIKPITPLNIGTLHFYYRPTSDGPQQNIDTQPTRQDLIFEYVSQNISKERNVIVSVIPVPTTQEKFMELLASNVLPEIYTGPFPNNEQIKPKLLSSSIEKFGPNLLAAIPESYWSLCKVKNDIFAIPNLITGNAYAVLANKEQLANNGWSIPTDFQEFESLLNQAKEKGITPISGLSVASPLMYWFSAPLKSYKIIKGNDGKMYPGYLAPQTLTYLKTIRRWADQGFIKNDNANENWLFKSATAYDAGVMDNVEIVPPISYMNSVTKTDPPVQTANVFVSYAKPDGLVVLMDWLVSSLEHRNALYMGLEKEDYTLKDDGTFDWTNGHPPWPGNTCFEMSGIFNQPKYGLKNVDTYNNALAVLQMHCNEKDDAISLPFISRALAKENSILSSAWSGVNSYEQIVGDACLEYVYGRMTYDNYIEIAKSNLSLMDKYIQLTQAYADGKYDIYQDMNLPTE